ncbi:MAG: carboxypeptidase regulatory-like domain-containing protein [Planctomycetes bacterium]|nr:carboxypeptidase regulatory-like domain-containing protein [Planctomycetota bacterium]
METDDDGWDDIEDENQDGRSARDLSLALDAFLAGRVLDSSAAPVPGVRIVARRICDDRDGSLAPTDAWTTETDESGGFRLESLPSGGYRLDAFATEDRPFSSQVVMAPSESTQIIRRRMIAWTLRGTVTDETGDPVPDAAVAVSGTPANARTGSGGDYVLVVPSLEAPGIDAVVEVSHPGYREGRRTIPIPWDEDEIAIEASFVLERGEPSDSLHGRVLGPDGFGVAGARLRLIREDVEIRRYGRSRDDGRFEFLSLPAGGGYWIEAQGAPPCARKRVGPFRVDDAPRDIVVFLDDQDRGRITGVLRTSRGRPLRHVRLLVRDEDSDAAANPVITDEDGGFDLDRAPAGLLEIQSLSTPTISVRGIPLEPLAHRHVSIEAPLGDQEIRGRLLASNGEPVPAARLLLSITRLSFGLEVRVHLRASSDDTGLFTFAGIAGGACRLSAEGPDGGQAVSEFLLPDGDGCSRINLVVD